MSAGEFVDGLLGRFVAQVVLVLALTSFVFLAIDAENGSLLIVGAGLLMPAVAWAFGVAFGRRQVYRKIGRGD